MCTLLYVDAPDERTRWLPVLTRSGVPVLALRGERELVAALRHTSDAGVVLVDAEGIGVAPLACAEAISAAALGPRPELHLFTASEDPTALATLGRGVDGLVSKHSPAPVLFAQLRAAAARADRLHELAAAHQALARLQLVDVETGLYNLRLLRLRLREELGRAAREERPLSLMLLAWHVVPPLEGELAHELGPALFRELATRAQAALRGYDILCRTAPERLAVLLTDTEATLASSLAQRLVAMLHGLPVTVGDHARSLQRNVGLAIAFAGLDQVGHGVNPGRLLGPLEQAIAGARPGEVVVCGQSRLPPD